MAFKNKQPKSSVKASRKVNIVNPPIVDEVAQVVVDEAVPIVEEVPQVDIEVPEQIVLDVIELGDEVSNISREPLFSDDKTKVYNRLTGRFVKVGGEVDKKLKLSFVL